jgi:SAM-dependent methyltransferase
MRLYIRGIEDYQYGVPWHSHLVRCPGCGLVSQDPRVEHDQIAGLYPGDYLQHRGQHRARGLYATLRNTIAWRTAGQLGRMLPANGTLLEVGCGDRRVLRALATRRPDAQLVGVDIRDVEGSEIPRLTFHRGQLELLDLPAGSADAVYCSRLIEHVADPVAFLAACRRLLKPGGRLRGVTPNHRSLDRLIFGKHWSAYHYPRHTFIFNSRNLPILLSKMGFTNVRVHGSYSYWSQSSLNMFLSTAARRRRGMLFVGVTAAFLPLDALLNLVTVHGAMTFDARSRE